MSDFFPPINVPQKLRGERKFHSNSTRNKRKEFDDPDEFGMTLQGWNYEEPEDFTRGSLLNVNIYQKACKNTLSNLSEGLGKAKKVSVEKGLLLDLSNSHSERLPNEDKEDEILKKFEANESPLRDYTGSGASKLLQKQKWQFRGNSNLAEGGISLNSRFAGETKKGLEIKVRSYVRSPERIELKPTIATTFKLDKLAKLLKEAESPKQVNNGNNSLLVHAHSSKNSVQVNFDSKPFPKQAAVLEKFQAIGGIGKSKSRNGSNLLSKSPQRNISLNPLELEINLQPKNTNALPAPASKRSLSCLNSSQMGAIIVSKRRAQRNSKNPFSDTKMGFESRILHEPTKVQVQHHEGLKALLDKFQIPLPNAALLTPSKSGLYQESNPRNEYTSKSHIHDAALGLSPVGVFKLPSEIKSKNLSPVSQNKLQAQGKDPNQLSQIWGNMKNAPMRSGRTGYGQVNSDLDEIVQYLLHNTSNNYHIPLKKSGSNDKATEVPQQKVNKAEVNDNKEVSSEKETAHSALKLEGKSPLEATKQTKKLSLVAL